MAEIDGVIKYRVEHLGEDSPECLGYPELESLRSRLFSLGLIGEKDGIGYGNISKRIGLDQTFFITSTQTGRLPSLEADQYAFISAYDFDSFTLKSKGKYKPSSEALTHAMIYEIHPSIQAVIHVHSSKLWHYMKDSDLLSTRAQYGTVEMVREVANLYLDRDPFSNNAFAMLGHKDGIITFGESIKHAELTLYNIVNNYLSHQ
ncbi:MAG: class II aldolase/adducin family protein [Mariprofundaceae bacterium]